MSFAEWYRKWQSEITWWTIGWLCFAVLDCILKGSWLLAAINVGLIFINYKFWRDR